MYELQNCHLSEARCKLYALNATLRRLCCIADVTDRVPVVRDELSGAAGHQTQEMPARAAIGPYGDSEAELRDRRCTAAVDMAQAGGVCRCGDQWCGGREHQQSQQLAINI
ncbi:MAG TPA: hypothetical protein VKK81_16715 [Candidatus Binatia bacterium]|nr:hypothetical protein [Candidatus Binatia bacterium]